MSASMAMRSSSTARPARSSFLPGQSVSTGKSITEVGVAIHVQSATNYCLPWAALRNIGRCAQWTVQTGGQYSTDILCTFIYYLLSSIPVGTGTYF